MEPILKIKDLRVGFKKNQHRVLAVNGTSFTLHQNETYAIVGESGCGKTLTSLSVMQLLPEGGDLFQPSQIIYQDRDILHLPEITMRKIRGREIAMIFQEPMTSLNPVLTIGEQIAEILAIHFKIYGKKAKARVIELLKQVKLSKPESLYDRYPHQLSGGMKQRVMIAMALAGEPKILIADEPTSALDVTVQAQIIKLLKNLQAATGMSILFITHDLAVVKQVADRIGVMYAGHIIEEADSKSFFIRPLHPYSQGLLASVPSLARRDQLLPAIPGNIPSLISQFSACRFANRCPYAKDFCHTVKPKWLQRKNHWVRCHIYDPQYAEAFQIIPSKEEATIISEGRQNHNFEKVLLKAENVKIHFKVKKGIFSRSEVVYAVDGVSFKIDAGKTVAIVGESGCGKTTLARGILKLLPLTQGNIQVNSWNLNQLSRKSFAQYRAYMQIVFQDPFSSMNPRMRVGDIILEGVVNLKTDLKPKYFDKELNQLLTLVGLSEDDKNKYPHEFSGGQRQRIAIARALAVKPKLIVCDEPTSALDVSIQAQILNLFKILQQEHGLSYLFITHNMAVVAYMADEVAVMQHGKIVEYGDVEQILNKPQHPYTQKLLAAVPHI